MVLLNHEGFHNGDLCSLVVYPVVLDPSNTKHLVCDSITKRFFRVEGVLNPGYVAYSLLDVRLCAPLQFAADLH